MLDKLIGDIKDKFQKKPTEDSGDKTNPSVTVPNDSTLKELLNESEENSASSEAKPEEVKKILGFKIPTDPKEKKSFFIRIGVGLFVIYFVVDEFVLKQASDESAAPVVTEAPVRKKKKKKPIEATPATEQPVQAPTETPVAEAASEPVKIEAEVITDATTNLPTQEKVNVEEVVNGKVEEVKSPEEQIVEVKPEEVKAPESVVSSGELELGTGQKSEDIKVEEKPTPEIKIEEKLNKIITQVDEDSKAEIKEYVAPPDYEVAGRGLVYNCVNKHWACVDRESYFTCEKNSRWLKKKKKAPECAVQNVYAADSDCQSTQKYNVQEIIAPKGCKL